MYTEQVLLQPRQLAGELFLGLRVRCDFASLCGQPALGLPQCLARVLNPDHPNIRYAIRM